MKPIFKKIVLYFLSCLAAYLLISCARRSPVPTPIDDPTEKASIVHLIQTEQQKLETLKASGSMAVTFQNMFQTLHFAAIYQSPNQLRVDVYAILSTLAGSMVIRGDSLFSYMPMTRQYMAISLTDSVLRESAKLPLPLNDFMALISGKLSLPTTPNIQIESLNDQHRLTWFSGQYRYEAWYHRQKKFLEHFQIINDQSTWLEADFSSYRRYNGLYRPGIIRITQRHGQEKLTLTMKHQEVNMAIDKHRFQLTLPPDAIRFSF